MQIIPLASIPAQTITAVLGGQSCAISVYQKSTGMFLDLLVAGAPVVTGMICRDRVRLVRLAYLKFTGDLAFMDTEGQSDPDYTGLGSRFQLMYLEPADL